METITYFLEFDENSEAVFINEIDNQDVINASDILRFNTPWTDSKESYINAKGFFESCNCFEAQSYGTRFFELSDCGEMLVCYE